jgi:hypothetical protein
MAHQTDELFDTEVTEDQPASELHTGAYQNEWGAKLGEFASDVSSFNKPFTSQELGEGQFMSVTEHARFCGQHNSRQRAGSAANAKLDADLEWADVRIKETRLVGKQLTRGIISAKNVQLANELAYQVGRIPLHGEQRHLQLQQLSNNVQLLRNQVKAGAQTIALGGSSDDSKVNFLDIDVETVDSVVEE